MKIGIFGGTFDPVHIGHLIIAERFCEIMELDKCLFVPTYLSPFKIEKNPIIPIEIRLKMLEIAINSNPIFEIETYEISRQEVSYTIDTIKYLQSKYPNDELYLLIGADQAKDFHLWKDFKEIMSILHLCVAKRGLDYELNVYPFELYLNNNSKQIYKLNTPIIEISSTEIRERIKEGKTVEYLLSANVYNFIKDNNIYK
jgi:nicotinate-nucleotide adenylyltransferase